MLSLWLQSMNRQNEVSLAEWVILQIKLEYKCEIQKKQSCLDHGKISSKTRKSIKLNQLCLDLGKIDIVNKPAVRLKARQKRVWHTCSTSCHFYHFYDLIVMHLQFHSCSIMISETPIILSSYPLKLEILFMLKSFIESSNNITQ